MADFNSPVSVEIEELPVKDLAGFIDRVSTYSTNFWVYRGQADFSRPLVPKAGRDIYFSDLLPFDGRQLRQWDLERFEQWTKQAVAYHDPLPSDDLERLALAQHYGLATRLLDWTTNPLVALYFAVDKDQNGKGIVYCYSAPGEITGGTFLSLDAGRPGRLYRPRAFDRRILAQSGVFTYHPNPQDVFEAYPLYFHGDEPVANLRALKIEAGDKTKIMQQLSQMGVTRKALFPDIEGLSDFINWGTIAEVNEAKSMHDKVSL